MSTQDDEDAKRKVSAMQTAGTEYISTFVEDIDDPFEMAIVTYALVVAGHQQYQRALVRLKEMQRKG